ncbi:MAG: hypothetical protein NVS2B9_10760 [Myxococcales bacterium]
MRSLGRPLAARFSLVLPFLVATACGGPAGGGFGTGAGGGGQSFAPSPWPVENRQFGAAEGILEDTVVGFSTDESQNRWVATHQALYLLRPGETRFRRYDARAGLHLQTNPVRYCDDWAPDRACPLYGGAADPGITEITGGGPNEVFVGYAGNTDGTQEFDDPNRHSGKLDRVRLKGDGTLSVDRIDLVSGVSVQFWHDRTVERLVYDHVRHAHELYVGTNHGVTRLLPDRYRAPRPGEWFNDVNKEYMADHLHPRVCYHAACTADESNQRIGDWRGIALSPDGDLWVAGKWTAGKIRWTANPIDWYARPGQQAFAFAFGDPYPLPGASAGFVNEPVFRVPLEGDTVSLSAVAVGKDGRVWFSSDPWNPADPALGVAVWDGKTFRSLDPQQDLGMAEQVVTDIAALPDGRLAFAGGSTGLVLYDPESGKRTALRGRGFLPDDRVLRLEVDARAEPFALHVATKSGAAVLRKLP